ncbi:MAG: hypothetical protein ACI9VT_000690 [Psychroserpens sp.]|jgi:hypothetical protein
MNNGLDPIAKKKRADTSEFNTVDDLAEDW